MQMHEARRLTAQFNEQGESVLDQLAHWAATRPDAPCFHYGDQERTLTYAEFGRLTDSVAGFLASRDVVPGTAVSVLSANPLVAALAMVGIWKAGAVFAPVNFNFTGQLLSYQLNDTGAPLLVVDAPHAAAVCEIWDALETRPELVVNGAPEPQSLPVGVHVSAFEADACQGHAPPDVRVEPHHPANIVYTSGTTGPAKGVLLPHRWMAQYTFMGRQLLDRDDVIYNDLPLYHVGGAIFNVVRGFWVGALVACWDRFSPGQFWQRIESVNATTGVLLDAMIPWLMNAPAGDDDTANSLCKVHMQPLPLNHHDVARRFGIGVVTCGFGQTESGNPLVAAIDQLPDGGGTPARYYRGQDKAVVLSHLRHLGVPVVTPEEAAEKGYMGKPTPFFDVAVLDEADEYCAPGEVGQLAVRPRVTNTIFAEYIGKPEATVRALRNAWFHTGDAARMGEDGSFIFVDRMGDRIRVRGENLSSYHVEDLFNQHPEVQISAALPVPATEGDEDEILIYLVLADGSPADEAAMRAWAEEQLPKFMRPHHIRFTDELPRTATNKTEKYKLRGRFLHETDADRS
ncbi:class I adenylate-forming enzyme family protein [Aquisalimonas sp. APHAB1-3]|uniref:class I adenylate-forming enzyme family protein n=1 Tax=Aquisalimonas sp. APHAB1-3 TaxID=3402080 RepID=UPI003AAEC035